MKLKNYVSLRRGGTSDLSRAIGVTRTEISIWANGKKQTPIKHCYAIEKATGGAVTRKDLRPHDWHEIWPELR